MANPHPRTPATKLPEELIAHIRKLWATEDLSITALAQRVGLSPRGVSRLCKGLPRSGVVTPISSKRRRLRMHVLRFKQRRAW